jgi:hypothetical protein
MPAQSASCFQSLAAKASVGFGALAILTLASLHILQPELGVGNSMMSQYSIGSRAGWVMNLSFFSFAAESLCLFAALMRQATGVLGWIGLVLLLFAAVGLASGGLFDMDPTTTKQEDMSFSGQMHGLAFMLGVPGELLACLLLTLTLRRKAEWKGVPLPILVALVWVSLIVMAVSLSSWMNAGQTGPAFFGIPNRSFMICYALWAIAAAWPLVQHQPQKREG